jgi:hypothetical protein
LNKAGFILLTGPTWLANEAWEAAGDRSVVGVGACARVPPICVVRAGVCVAHTAWRGLGGVEAPEGGPGLQRDITKDVVRCLFWVLTLAVDFVMRHTAWKGLGGVCRQSGARPARRHDTAWI